MKKIRLEFPLGKDKYLPKKVWLKVNDKQTEAFEDRKFTVPILATGKKVSLAVNVPEELELIEIIGLGGTTPDGDISLGWCMNEANPNWRVPGLKKVTVIFDDRIHEVPVIDEKPDRKDWDYYREHTCDGWLFLKNWALVVYTLETQTIAAFHWHPNLIKELETKKRNIILSKRNFPCMWEKGGQIDEFTGNSTIICDANGNKMKPIFIKKRGTLACSEHALIVIHEGDVIIEVSYQKYYQFKIYVLKIIDINLEERKAEVEYIDKFLLPPLGMHSNDYKEYIVQECSDTETEKYKDAILNAYAKAMCYHCRDPYFIKTE